MSLYKFKDITKKDFENLKNAILDIEINKG